MTGPDDRERVKRRVLNEVRRHFRPEFVNRIDDLVVFHALGKEEVARIAQLQFALLDKRLAEQQMSISLSQEALHALVEEGYDPVYGARPLKRAIRRRIENPLAAKLLAGELGPGDEVSVQWADNEFRMAGRPGDNAG